MPTRTLTIVGKPYAKERPRFARGRVYTPSKTLNYEGRIANLYQTKYPGAGLLTGALVCYIFVLFPVPKSASKAKRKLMIEQKITPKTKKDLDNIAKILCDGLNLIAYHDDSQIAELMVTKQYSENPRTIIILNETEPGDARL